MIPRPPLRDARSSWTLPTGIKTIDELRTNADHMGTITNWMASDSAAEDTTTATTIVLIVEVKMVVALLVKGLV
jgi:hypothetical protein